MKIAATEASLQKVKYNTILQYSLYIYTFVFLFA